jgi:hypothetical protein
VYCPTVEYIRPRGTPSERSTLFYLATHFNSLHSQFREFSCNHIHPAYSPGRRVLRISKRPEPVNIVHCPSCIWHEPFCYSCRHRPTPKNTLRGNPGCAVGPKTPTPSAGHCCCARCTASYSCTDIPDTVEGGSGSVVSSQGVAATPSKLHSLTRGHEAVAGRRRPTTRHGAFYLGQVEVTVIPAPT